MAAKRTLLALVGAELEVFSIFFLSADINSLVFFNDI